MLVTSLIAGGLALALLVLIYWRTAQRYEALKVDVERMQVVQRDMTTDVRARLDEGARSWDRVESDLTPRLDKLEPSLADLSATLEESLPALGEARTRLEKLEAQFDQVEADLRTAQETGVREAGTRAERIEAAVRTLRNAADERLADLAARIQALEPAAEEPEVEEPKDEQPEDEQAGSGEAPSDGPEVVWEDAEGEGALAAVGSSDEAEATPAATRGTPPARSARWIFLILALVAGLALALTANG